MPRYLIERTFAEGDASVAHASRAESLSALICANAREGVTWVHSYVAPDRQRSWCICDGPSPEAIRAAARANGWPVDRVSEVRVLDPYLLRCNLHPEKGQGALSS
jgi:hypothetical protein